MSVAYIKTISFTFIQVNEVITIDKHKFIQNVSFHSINLFSFIFDVDINIFKQLD